MKKKHGWIGRWDFRCFDAEGNLKWEDLNRENFLADEGEQMMLDVFLRAGTAPTGFYVRLFNDTPVETDTLADLLNEPAGTYGYAAQAVARDATAAGWPTLALDSGDYQAIAKTVTFTASGGSIGPVTHGVLATTSNNTGKHISSVALSTSRTLANGESLQVTFKVKLSEAA
jgi:hypothetical protein